MKITVKKIMALNPCLGWTEERLRKLIGKGKTPLDCLSIKGVSVDDKIWCATKFLPDKANRKFAIWCARQCKITIKEIKIYIDIIEKYYSGKATKKQLDEASSAAYSAASSAASSAAMRKKQLRKLKSIIKKLLESEG